MPCVILVTCLIARAFAFAPCGPSSYRSGLEASLQACSAFTTSRGLHCGVSPFSLAADDPSKVYPDFVRPSEREEALSTPPDEGAISALTFTRCR